MNQFVMTESGRDVEFQIVSARIALVDSGAANPVCKIQIIASHPDLPENAVLWFDALKEVRGPTFSLREEVMESGAGFYLFEHQALEDVRLDLHLDQQKWCLELTCALLSMGWNSQRFKVSADLELCDDLDPLGDA